MFLNEEFLNLYNKLSHLQESKSTSRPFKQGTVEAARPINLADCRMIASDVVDVRGELEESACLVYNDVLTRVAASVLPFRDGPEGKEVCLKLWRSAVYLLGGGVDLSKDGTDPVRTVIRETFEEANMKLTNIKDSGASYWEYSEKPWVAKHVANPEDHWNGYYTWLFTADYQGNGDNDLPEEDGNFRWYKVSDILSRPDTKKMKFIKQAIINAGYGNESAETPLEEDALTEAKQLGFVSYAVRKSPQSQQHPLRSLINILKSGVILASTEEDGSKYVSTSRNLVGHLGAVWKCGIVLDGDKLTNKYKATPVNYNSMVYFGEGRSTKQLELKYISKYQACSESGEFLDEYFYTVGMNGCSFVPDISETTYNILKTIMQAYNAKLSVKTGGKAKAQNQGRTNKDLKKYYELSGRDRITTGAQWQSYMNDNTPEGETPPQWMQDTVSKLDNKTSQPWLNIGTRMRNERVPSKYSGRDWICVETVGYNVAHSGLILKLDSLGEYKEVVFSHHGADVTSSNFFRQLGGVYADEAEERLTARLVDFIEDHSESTDETQSNKVNGINISGCVKAILVDEKHTMAFSPKYDHKKSLFLYKDGQPTSQVDNTPGIKQMALELRSIAEQLGVPIILFNSNTTNQEILNKIKQ